MWIDENGTIVRPAEPAWPKPRKPGRIDLPEGTPQRLVDIMDEAANIVAWTADDYGNAVRDWAANGADSSFVMAADEVLARYDLSSMKRLIVGAAPFPVELRRRTMELFPNPCLYEFYGATETGVNTIIGPEEHLRKPGSCGRATPGNEIRILDDEGKEVPVGEVGTLYFRNPILISRYHKNQKATQESLRDGYFTVGDMARVDEDGYYFIVDRKKDMIISGGVNIYPAEIEIELHRHPAVYDCAVIGVPNEEWGEEVKALVQLKPGARATAEELQEFLGQRLADYKRPRSVDFVDELPYNPTGKLLKRELRRRYWEAAGRSI